MQSLNFHLLEMYKSKGMSLASVEVCRDVADCILLYKAYLSKFYYCDVHVCF